MRTAHLLVTRINVRVGGTARADADWFRARLQLFKTFTLPSIACQEHADFEWLLLANRTTPQWALQELHDLVAGVHMPVTVGSPDRKDITGHFAAYDMLLTTRLDSDDALHPSALGAVSTTHDEDPFRYRAYVFPSGYLYDVPTGRMAAMSRCRPALTTKVNQLGVDDPLDVGGNHNFVIERYRSCEVDRPGGMFLRTLHDNSTERSVYADSRATLPPDVTRATFEAFGIDPVAAGRLATKRNGHRAQSSSFSMPVPVGSAPPVPSPADAVVTISIVAGPEIDNTVRAVASLLDQSLHDVAIVVFGSNDFQWERVRVFDDRRVMCVALGADVPVLFAHDIALEATASEYFAMHDPDGWADPECLSALVSAARSKRAGAAVTPAQGERGPSRSFVLFRAAALRESGGCNGGAGDEATASAHALALVGMLGPVVQSAPLLFHLGAADSPAAPCPARLVALRREASAYYLAYLDGDCSRAHLVARFQQLAHRYRSLDETVRLTDAASKLRRALVLGDTDTVDQVALAMLVDA